MVSQSPYYVESARIDLRRYPAARDAYEQLCELADASGVITLEGGVRGWAQTLGCALGYPKKLLAQLEAAGYVAGVEFYPGEGGQVAEVHLVAPAHDQPLINASPDRSLIHQAPAPAPGLAPSPIPHQDAKSPAPAASGVTRPDRSLIESPQTPRYGTKDSESMCGGGGGGGRMRESDQGDQTPEHQAIRQALIEFGVPADVAEDLAPRATLAQLANLQASAAERAADPVAWVIAGVRAGRGKPAAPLPAATQRPERRRGPGGPRDDAAAEEERRASLRAFAERQAAERAAEAVPPAPPPRPYLGPPPPPAAAPPPPPSIGPLFDRSQRGTRRLGPAAERARERRQQRGTP
jgi:hypothetical protein